MGTVKNASEGNYLKEEESLVCARKILTRFELRTLRNEKRAAN
jgi:hypothetical protein